MNPPSQPPAPYANGPYRQLSPSGPRVSPAGPRDPSGLPALQIQTQQPPAPAPAPAPAFASRQGPTDTSSPFLSRQSSLGSSERGAP